MQEMLICSIYLIASTYSIYFTYYV